MAVPETEAARVKMPVGEVVMAAYGAVFGRLGQVLELAWLPLLILLAVELVPGVAAEYLWPGPPDPTPTPFDAEELVETVVALLCLNAFAVRWQQATLFGAWRTLPRRRFFAAWARFLGYAVVLYVPTIGPLAALALWGRSSADEDAARILVGATAVLAILAALAIARFSLVFPAAAYGAPMGLLAAWRWMRGNAWRLIAATLLACLPVFIAVSMLLSAILGAANLRLDELPPRPPIGLVLLSGVVDVVLNFLFCALGASIIAEFYRRIVLNAADERKQYR